MSNEEGRPTDNRQLLLTDGRVRTSANPGNTGDLTAVPSREYTGAAPEGPRRSSRTRQSPQFFRQEVYGAHGVRVQPTVESMNNRLRDSARRRSSIASVTPRRGSRLRQPPQFLREEVYDTNGVRVRSISSTSRSVRTDAREPPLRRSKRIANLKKYGKK